MSMTRAKYLAALRDWKKRLRFRMVVMRIYQLDEHGEPTGAMWEYR